MPLETFAEEQTVVEEAAETAEGTEPPAEPVETTVVKIVQPLAVPLVSFMDILYYNIELLQAAGFDRPPKTREEYLVFSRTISGSTGETLADVKGSALGLNPQDRQSMTREIFSWIWAAGYDFWSGEGELPVINTRQIGRDLAFFGNLYRDSVITPESFDMTGDQVIEQFIQGKIAMMIASSRAIHILREKMNNEIFGITTIPGTDPIGKYSVALSGTYAGINSACEYPQAAMAFLNFLYKQKPLICSELKAVPGDVSELFSGEYKDYMKDDPFSSKAWSIFEASKVIQGFAGKERGDTYESIFREELKKFFEDNQTYTQRVSEAAARSIEQRWDQLSPVEE
jgi:multiple sugar transport system substrate-binding protein